MQINLPQTWGCCDEVEKGRDRQFGNIYIVKIYITSNVDGRKEDDWIL
jgi:hypothetical protein